MFCALLLVVYMCVGFVWDIFWIVLGITLKHICLFLLCGDVPRIIIPGRRAPAHRAQGWNIPFRGTPHSDMVPHPFYTPMRVLLNYDSSLVCNSYQGLQSQHPCRDD